MMCLEISRIFQSLETGEKSDFFRHRISLHTCGFYFMFDVVMGTESSFHLNRE
jgi:hypothetical protein